MAEDNKDTFQTAVQQQGDRAWPVPGDEGYVHPDGTPHSVQQLADNQRAAADRAAAGSIIHGAPAATPGPQVQAEAAAAQRRAAAESPVSPADAKSGLTEFVREGFDRAAEKAANADESPRDAQPDPNKRTATTTGGKTTR